MNSFWNVANDQVDGVEIISNYLLIHQLTHLPHVLHNHIPYKIGIGQSLCLIFEQKTET